MIDLLSKMGLDDEAKDLQMEMVEKMLPMAKKFAPKIEKEASDFMKENECTIIVQRHASGDITASVLNENLVVILPTSILEKMQKGEEVTEEEFKQESDKMFVKNSDSSKKIFSMKSIVELFIEGGINKFLK
jgi:hypothetical protein